MPALRAQPAVHAPDAERRQGDGQGATVLVHARLVCAELDHAEIGQHLQRDGQGRSLILEHTGVHRLLPGGAGLASAGSPAPGVGRGEVRVEQGVHPDRAADGVEGGRHAVQVLGLQHDGERLVPGGQDIVGGPGGEQVEPVPGLGPGAPAGWPALADLLAGMSTSMRVATATRHAASNSAGISSRCVAAARASARRSRPALVSARPGPIHRATSRAARSSGATRAAAASSSRGASRTVGSRGGPPVSVPPCAFPFALPRGPGVVRDGGFRREVATPAPYGLPG